MKIPSKSWNMIDGALVFKAPQHFHDTDKNDASYEKDLAEYYKQPSKLDVALQEREELNELAFEPLYIRSLAKQMRRHRDGKSHEEHKNHYYTNTARPRRLAKRKSYENSRQRCLASKQRFAQNLRRIVLEDIEYGPSQPPVETKRNSIEDLKKIYEEDLFTKGWCRDQVNIDRALELEERYEGYILRGLRTFAEKHTMLPEGCATRAWATDSLYLDVKQIERWRGDHSFDDDYHADDDIFDGYDDYEYRGDMSHEDRPSSSRYDDDETEHEEALKDAEEEAKILLAFETRHDHLEQEFVRGAKKVRA